MKNNLQNQSQVENFLNKNNQTLQQREQKFKQDMLKQTLLKQLNEVIKDLSNVEDLNFDSKKSPINDHVIEKLSEIQRKAMMADLLEVKRFCVLAIGRRIFNIELKKRKQQYNEKIQKKRQIQQFFRQNRIKKKDYQTLVANKLAENSLICQPYASGKGFIESQNYYSDQYKALDECSYLQVVKEVNKIFFKNFTGIDPKAKHKSSQIVFKISICLLILFMMITIITAMFDFMYEGYILNCLLGLMLICLSYVSISTYIERPNKNNQLEQTLEDIKQYFTKVNEENKLKQKWFEWICPDDLMYLEVKFHCGLPK